MAYRIFSFLILGLLVGCQSSRDIKPVESGKVVVVKRWSKEQDLPVLGEKPGDLNSVAIDEHDPWHDYSRALGKNLETPPKMGTEKMFPGYGQRGQ